MTGWKSLRFILPGLVCCAAISQACATTLTGSLSADDSGDSRLSTVHPVARFVGRGRPALVRCEQRDPERVEAMIRLELNDGLEIT